MDDENQSSPIAPVVERNIRALIARRTAREHALTWQERLATHISRFAGSMAFVWLHLAFYGLWITINVGLIPPLPRFDPDFVLLAMEASVEAIFLSTFILITQNRMMAHSERRADLNLQISLLAEHEVTRLIAMVTEIGQRMNVSEAHHNELQELRKTVDPERVLDALEHSEAGLSSGGAKG
jgi:uncharacterized membrane protein